MCESVCVRMCMCKLMLGIHTALNIVTKDNKQEITALQQTKTETSFCRHI